MQAVNAASAPHEEDDPSAITLRELAEMMHRSRSSAQEQIRILIKDGKAERTTKWLTRADGSKYPSPAYRLIK